MDNTQYIAEELTKLRKEKRMTQEQLAELAGVSQNHLSKLESGCRQ
ncbi:TPA: helix-turn-helix transcriptional regulator [Clostridioides difficile]|nr:helix-turn-helix transcriptional regulator [Clostridioides difficile]ELX4576154.1 helix-turn-helix transcriptional regulator [Clostridioides difficile]EQK76110.1 helix-turn-helix family protein [Clostridioides difficile CD113]MBH6986784.1 helix-turn-helix transcriptional regulator [Clostridioides difficile]MBH7139329.1 helix-turn-helix transcriptional regulator [Clostridioides difficile]MBY1993286.1 helix-turn-helix domain-containing protein [Clostridioides difficile]